MIGSLFRYLFHIVINVLIFIGLSWLLLGIPPKEAYERSTKNLRSIFGRMGSVSTQTISGIKEEADVQAEHISDRMQGNDPYEKIAKRLDATVGRGGYLNKESN